MGALWGNLLTKLKHIKVKHRAVSPHLIRDSRGRRQREDHQHTEGYYLFIYFKERFGILRLNALLDFYYVTLFHVGCTPNGGQSYWIYNASG